MAAEFGRKKRKRSKKEDQGDEGFVFFLCSLRSLRLLHSSMLLMSESYASNCWMRVTASSTLARLLKALKRK